MATLISLAVGLTFVAGMLAHPSPTEHFDKRAAQVSYPVYETDISNGGFFLSGNDDCCYNGPGGQFRMYCQNCVSCMCGKGWNPGSMTPISFSSTINFGGNGLLAIYGWTRNPLVEYYVVENFGIFNPASGGVSVGSVESDCSTYDVYKQLRVNQPSIRGTQTFQQYWSIRRFHRNSGTVNVRNHFAAWAQMGMNLGQFDYQVVLVAAYQSSISAEITVSRSSGSGGCGGGIGTASE